MTVDGVKYATGLGGSGGASQSKPTRRERWAKVKEAELVCIDGVWQEKPAEPEPKQIESGQPANPT